MPWTVEYDHELDVVKGTYVGRVTADEFKEATIKAIGLAKDHNTNLFLIDDSNWEGGASVAGLIGLPDLYEKLKADRCSRAALILPSSGTAALEDARFYETVCLNRGWQVKVFSTRQDAVAWLIDKESPNMRGDGDG